MKTFKQWWSGSPTSITKTSQKQQCVSDKLKADLYLEIIKLKEENDLLRISLENSTRTYFNFNSVINDLKKESYCLNQEASSYRIEIERLMNDNNVKRIKIEELYMEIENLKNK